MRSELKGILDRAIEGEALSLEDAMLLYDHAPIYELAAAADKRRGMVVADSSVVTWQIDRNVNITNVCISGCKFCNFHCKPHQHERHFITSMEEYRTKIDRMLELGGDQLLLQGGLHPQLDINYYERLFQSLKQEYPTVKLHALGAPEVSHIAKVSRITTLEALQRLHKAGLDSLPGAGAEILNSDIRRKISPAKPSVEEWCDVMREAHEMGLSTSATMMYGHIESARHRVEHLILIRQLQQEAIDRCKAKGLPSDKCGFIAFIPWIFHSHNTPLEAEGVRSHLSSLEYIRIIAISRLVLNNITNIQASWLTVGRATAQIALHSGANDFGSIMIEENVVSSAGADHHFDAIGIQHAITDAGFTPQLRNQFYEPRELPCEYQI